MSKIRVGSCLSLQTIIGRHMRIPGGDHQWMLQVVFKPKNKSYVLFRTNNAASCYEYYILLNFAPTTLFQSQCVLPTRIAITKAQCYNTGHRCRQQLRQIGTYAYHVHCHNIPKFSRHILGYSPALKRPLHLLHVPATKVHAHIFFSARHTKPSSICYWAY